jgi:hypothetical protein
MQLTQSIEQITMTTPTETQCNDESNFSIYLF